jgi:hypothetical protein
MCCPMRGNPDTPGLGGNSDAPRRGAGHPKRSRRGRHLGTVVKLSAWERARPRRQIQPVCCSAQCAIQRSRSVGGRKTPLLPIWSPQRKFVWRADIDGPHRPGRTTLGWSVHLPGSDRPVPACQCASSNDRLDACLVASYSSRKRSGSRGLPTRLRNRPLTCAEMNMTVSKLRPG